MNKKTKCTTKELLSEGSKIRNGMVPLSWFTKESSDSENIPDELLYPIIELARKYGIGGILLVVGSVCFHSLDETGRKAGPIYNLSLKLRLLLEETNCQMQSHQDSLEKSIH